MAEVWTKPSTDPIKDLDTARLEATISALSDHFGVCAFECKDDNVVFIVFAKDMATFNHYTMGEGQTDGRNKG